MKGVFIMHKFFKILISSLAVGLALGIGSADAYAAESSLDTSPYVRWSSTHGSWTLGEGNTWYEEGTVVNTGVKKNVPTLKAGQHFYASDKKKVIPVGQWIVKYKQHNCIHGNTIPFWNGEKFYVAPAQIINGVPREEGHGCFARNYSGWIPICADCGEEMYSFFYASKEAVSSIKYIQDDTYYFSKCVSCGHAETAVELQHKCKSEVSNNKYVVEYKENGGMYGMLESTFMYDNAQEYEGMKIQPDTKLRKNQFERTGYTFVGWSLYNYATPDEVMFTDEEEIFNYVGKAGNNSLLTEGTEVENGIRITLYAIWKRSESTLNIDPNGGNYEGNTGITSVTQVYNMRYKANPNKLVPPAGYTVSFDTQGGDAISSIVNTTSFKYWNKSADFNGSFNDETNIYTFLGKDKAVDTLTAMYVQDEITLPMPSKENYSFGGWYKDAGYTEYVGRAGDKYQPSSDITLYAHWVSLALTAVNNYTVFNGTGAVDLSWTQPDNTDKVYSIYQKSKGDWENIGKVISDEDDTKVENIGKYKSSVQTYKIPKDGVYSITAYGANGANYVKGSTSFNGGKGGLVTMKVWLNKDETLTYYTGGKNGYHNGGPKESGGYTNGGGYTEVILTSKNKERNNTILLIAGGGGGASPVGNGGDGGIVVDSVDDAPGLLNSKRGEKGKVGGGGGYFAGKAGELTFHVHDKTTCGYHTHTSACGTMMTCGNTLGGTLTSYCVDKGTEGTAYHWYERKCTKGHITKVQSDVIGIPCQFQLGYSKCSKPEGYLCGKKTTYVESSVPSYGGSSYINKDLALTSSYEIGGSQTTDGNGYVYICSTNMYFTAVEKMDGVKATDYAAPNAVDVTQVRLYPYVTEVAGSITKHAQVVWAAPLDNGTKYYHKVESYKLTNGSIKSNFLVSNVTENILTSGVEKYYYATNVDANYKITESNKDKYTTSEFVLLDVYNSIYYLHIAAADKTGNLSDTIHIKIEPEKLAINWPLYTNQITIEGSNTYPTGEVNKYFVKGGPDAHFFLNYTGYMDVAATTNYQIDTSLYSISALQAEEQLELKIPSANPYDESTKFEGTSLIKTITGEGILNDGLYSSATKTNYAASVEMSQRYIAPAEQNGKTITVVPRVFATNTISGEQEKSDIEEDNAHAIYLIVDSEGPVIDGADVLKDISIIDRSDKTKKLILDLNAHDALSGLKNMTVSIVNLDNYMERTYETTTGELTVDITQEDLLFNGEFSIEILATDNVGNQTSYEYNLQEYTLRSDLYRKNDLKEHEKDNSYIIPDVPTFKAGEAGLLTVSTTGYVDKIIATYEIPVYFIDVNPDKTSKVFTQEYVYNETSYDNNVDLRTNGVMKQDISFIVPVDARNGKYKVTITAFKDGVELPLKAVEEFNVYGSILEEIRTIEVEKDKY